MLQPPEEEEEDQEEEEEEEEEDLRGAVMEGVVFPHSYMFLSVGKVVINCCLP